MTSLLLKVYGVVVPVLMVGVVVQCLESKNSPDDLRNSAKNGAAQGKEENRDFSGNFLE